MKIGVIGSGYVGLTTGICLASLGHKIFIYDVDEEKLEKIKEKKLPFWKKINNLELFEKTENNLLRIVIEPSNGSKMIKYLNNKFKYYIDWCGSLFWVEVPAKKNMKVKEIKKIAIDFGGYLTIVKTSSDYDFDETIFTVDDVRLIISKKIKESFDPKRILNPGKMYRGI